MFTTAEETERRPRLVVEAPTRGFVLKYLEREFNRDIISPDEATDETGLPWIMLSSTDGSEANDASERAFAERCEAAGCSGLILRLPPFVIGTGMDGLPRTLARGVARGTMLRIKDNQAEVSAVHATDIARVARILATPGRRSVTTVTVGGQTILLNDLISALGVRIKDKRVGTIKPRWAKILYGQSLYGDLTTSRTVDDSDLRALLPADFEFVNPAEYLKTHVYDHESL